MNVRISDEWRDKLEAAGFPMEDLCLGVAEEILRRLPAAIEQDNIDDDFLLTAEMSPGGSWDVGYHGQIEGLWAFPVKTSESLSNAAASMFCHLAKHGLLPKA